MPAAYCVQYAASNRSTCKTCKTKIDAGALRIGTITAGPGDYDITSWRHLACNKQPKGLVEAELAGFDALRPPDQQAVRDWRTAAAASPAKKRSADELQAVVELDPKKMKLPALKKALQQHGLKPEGGKAAMAALLSEVVERSALELRYSALSLPELKALCEANAQLKGGTKPELVQRCIDGKLHGALPRCPQCGGGLLKVVYAQPHGHGGQGRFSCPGFHDGDAFQRCPYTATSAVRLPWVEP